MKPTTSAISLPLLASALAVVSLSYELTATATPIYSVRAANACDTCHVEPIDWANPAEEDRLCTMDCKGCHISPTGGGLRTPSGAFYGKEVLPMFGRRPSASTNPKSRLRQGVPSSGRYRLGEGFSGWWPGKTSHLTIADRYGDIDPEPTVLVGADSRFAFFRPNDGSGASLFPMQNELYLAVFPTHNTTLYGSAGLRGSRSQLDLTGSADTEFGFDRKSDYASIRELFVKLDGLPHNSHVRAGRLSPAYGWRIPDHTSFVRRGLGFDQNRQVFGIEAGLNPNYPYALVNAFVQGAGFWPGDNCFRVDECTQEGYGTTITGGYRALGWTAGGSLHVLDRTGTNPSEVTSGINWGVNLYPLVYLGELDFRRFLAHDDGDAGDIDALFAYHELAVLATRGLSFKLKYDWRDPDLDVRDDHAHRLTGGIEINPITYVNIEAQYRMSFVVADEAIDNDVNEMLFLLHLWI